MAGLAAHRATGRRRILWLAAMLVLGFWAFSIREFAVAAPLAVLTIEFITDRSRRIRVAEITLGFIAVAALFWVWRHRLPGGQSFRPPASAFETGDLVVQACFTATFGLLPAITWSASGWWKPIHAKARVWGMAAGLLLAAVPLAYTWSSGGTSSWLVGDYLNPTGVSGNSITLGSRSLGCSAASSGHSSASERF